MLQEIVFDFEFASRRDDPRNCLFHQFLLKHPDFRLRLRDLRCTKDTAWLIHHAEGSEATLAAYDEWFPEGSATDRPIRDSHVLSFGPTFRIVYERQTRPRNGEQPTIWSLAAATVGPEVRLSYEMYAGRTRVTAAHEDRDRLAAFIEKARRDVTWGDVRFVRLGAAEDCAAADVMDEDARLLQLAWVEGYYARPRRTTLRDLAEKVGVPHATLGYRLRRAESRAVGDVLKRTGNLTT